MLSQSAITSAAEDVKKNIKCGVTLHQTLNILNTVLFVYSDPVSSKRPENGLYGKMRVLTVKSPDRLDLNVTADI